MKRGGAACHGDLLHGRAADLGSSQRRSALRHTAWLALAHARAGDPDASAEAARAALTRLPQIASRECRDLLCAVAAELETNAPRPGSAAHAVLADLRRTLR
ncbi:hypothetical protein D5H75_33200 [Bailinhaonella thermotolerans]|uniref:Uncharacterized protein n=2 Tax=Bailinhaonella thermotolerans TaxID=1070861 RepID=A0A3A4A5V1_9ACTN|nr:hypothetical protein D5H75_33200 [Bailinhaonella thermotolerans]